ncbi:MAG: cyclomaltodextrinase [Phycisphaerales bacterium]
MPIRHAAPLAAIALAGCAATSETPMTHHDHASVHDLARAPIYEAREADWRNGAIVYQVIVDRFAPPLDLDSKRHLYPAPKTLHAWDEQPVGGVEIPELGLWSHELAFWGGDLESLATKVGYIHDLGVDVLYLNPIHAAYTNHKYDAQDYNDVSPEYGDREDVRELARTTEAMGMKLVLDGVFNHMGRTSPRFIEARDNPESEFRDWYVFTDESEFGYRGWYNVKNLPEMNLENPDVRAHIWGDQDSVVRSYLRDGVDGWRLDVAFDIGPKWLTELTEAAHDEKPGSLVVGEIWNYPEEWFPAIDGIMNFHARQIIFDVIDGRISGAHAGRLLERMCADCDYEHLLKSWIMLDNHDTPRLATYIPDASKRRMAQALQFTIPGAPNLYYGSELGMTGGHDPEQRGLMAWHLVTDENEELAWTKTLLDLRNASRALKVGDFRLLDTERLLAFSRRTDRVDELVVVVCNPTANAMEEVVPLRESKVMNHQRFVCALTGVEAKNEPGLLRVTCPARTVLVLRPEIGERGEHPYSSYKRVR